jgi:hypothetical protein
MVLTIVDGYPGLGQEEEEEEGKEILVDLY